jgi:hypothetical protein
MFLARRRRSAVTVSQLNLTDASAVTTRIRAVLLALRMAASLAIGIQPPHHPAALRNRVPIADALEGFGLDAGPALEIGSGTGAHIELFAERFPQHISPQAVDDVAVTKTPFDESRRSMEIIDSYGCVRHSNVLPAVALDGSQPFSEWPQCVTAAEGRHRLVYCSNVCHISPWTCTRGIITGAECALAQGGSLVIYGPFKVDGKAFPESNAAFDLSLRERNPLWGLRDLDELSEQALQHGLTLAARISMPANNYLLRFIKN